MPLPEASKLLGERISPFGGWMVAAADRLSRDKSVQLIVAFPWNTSRIRCLRGAKITYYAFPAIKNDIWSLRKGKENFRKILNEVSPDILHIYGTEFAHSYVVAHEFEPSRTLLRIQGLVGLVAKHYIAGLPNRVLMDIRIGDLVFRRFSILHQRASYRKQAILENDTVQTVGNLSGRTDWDLAFSLAVNPMAQYFHLNETLRPDFYKGSWKLINCRRKTIFMSQASYPVKGLHFVIEALGEVVKHHPDVRLLVAGYDIISHKGIKNVLKESSYGHYIRRLVWKYGLQDNVAFTGLLDAGQVHDALLRAHVYVSASTIENESNSLSEAKLLGVPCVVSFVGGITSRICHNEDGFAYQHDAPYMLAYYLCRLFEEDSTALRFSEASRRNAIALLDPKTNNDELMRIYRTMLLESKATIDP